MQVLGHDIQLVLAQFGQQVLGQNQAVHRRVVEGDAVLLTPGGDKAHVEVGVVGGQGPVPGKGQKGPQRLLLRGRSGQHLVGDAGEADDLRRQHAPRGGEGVEGIGNLPVFQHHCADLDDDLVLLVQAGGLNVEADDLAVEGGVCLPVDRHPVVHVVDVVGLHAEEDLDFLGRVLGVGEGVGHPVVGDGDGRVAPGLGPLDHVLVPADGGVGLEAHRRQGVHGGHVGVQMELHPFLWGGVHPGSDLRHTDRRRLQHHIAVKTVQVQPALDLDVHPLFDPVHQRLPLLAGKELVHPDGAGVVRDIEGHHPGSPLFQLLVVDGEDVPLHHHGAHIQFQIPDWDRGLGDGPAEDNLALGLFVPLGRSGTGGVFQRRPADGLRAGKGVQLLLGLGRFRRVGNLRVRRGSGLRRLDLHAGQAVGPAQCLLRLDDQVRACPGGPLHRDLGAAAGLVDGGGQDQPALHPVAQLGPLAQGGKHL